MVSHLVFDEKPIVCFTFGINSAALNAAQIARINQEETFAGKFELIELLGYELDLAEAGNEIFKSNLQTIDTNFPVILANVLLHAYANLNEENNLVKSLIRKTSKDNILGYNLAYQHKLYEIKMKRFLADYALGMSASNGWMGEQDTRGGYTISSEDDTSSICHFNYKNQFENYLLNNTKFDTPSPNKHGFGSIYKEGEEYFLKLNLQIRFVK